MTKHSLSTNPEDLWDRLLSRQPAQIRAAFSSLSPDEQASVLTHLSRMAEEAGWHEEQQRSARAALQALSKSLPTDRETGPDRQIS